MVIYSNIQTKIECPPGETVIWTPMSGCSCAPICTGSGCGGYSYDCTSEESCTSYAIANNPGCQ